MYAVIQTGGKQYKVTEGDVIFVEKLDAEEGATYTFNEVLAVSGAAGFRAGNPTVEGASVTATVVKNGKSKKIHIHRKEAGVIHFDGDPIMTSADVDVEIVEKGINIIVNPYGDKRVRRPNAIQSAAAELFNEINIVKEDITKQTRHIQALSKVLQRKLNL